jgi:hypothetical protein
MTQGVVERWRGIVGGLDIRDALDQGAIQGFTRLA